MNEKLMKFMIRMAREGDPDAVEELAASMEQMMEDPPAEEPAEESGKDPLLEEMEKIVQQAIDSVSWSNMTPDEQITDILNKIYGTQDNSVISNVLEPDNEDEERAWRIGDSLRIAMTVIRPVLERMTYAESKRAISEIADHIRQTGLDSQSHIAVGRADDSKKAPDYAGLAEKIMRERNPNFIPKEEK